MGQRFSRIAGRDTLLALLVLALVLLNFGHASIGTGGELTLTPDSWCNDPLVPISAEHPPCHACRIGSGADLPPASAEGVPACFNVARVVYAAPAAAQAADTLTLAPRPRGPPSA
jgi:hypothetical protein